MSSVARTAVYQFDRFCLDLRRGALLVAGEERTLRPKSFAMLLYLVQNPERLIDRDEIMRAVWPGVVVTEDSITQCIREIRHALADADQRLIRTLPRRGDLFAAAVTTEAAATVNGALAGSADAPPRPATGRPMVVVLPFEIIGQDPEQAYFASGLTADLVTDLTRFQSLHVITPRKGGEPPAGANYLVSGSLRRTGGRVRVTALLQDAQSGIHLWAERFDRPVSDLFDLQEELAGHIAARLVTHLDQEGLRRSKRRPPASLDAYDLCLRGRELHSRGTEADTLQARALFEQAIALDQNYAAAYAWLSFTVQRGFTHWWGEPHGPAALGPALEFAQRAVEIEPESPLCVSRLAIIQLYLRRWEEALHTGLEAVRLNPCSFYGRQSLSEVLLHAGEDREEAVRETLLALELDPFHPPGVRNQLGRALLLAGRAEEALAELRPLAARMPDYGPCYHTLVVAAVETGRMAEARSAVREVLRLGPHWTARTIDALWFFRRPEDTERFRAAYRAAGLPADE
jgi:TolB-like protein